MCKCTPSIRTPYCGAFGCTPPNNSEVIKPVATNHDAEAMSCISRLLDLCEDDHKFVKSIRPIILMWRDCNRGKN